MNNLSTQKKSHSFLSNLFSRKAKKPAPNSLISQSSTANNKAIIESSTPQKKGKKPEGSQIQERHQGEVTQKSPLLKKEEKNPSPKIAISNDALLDRLNLAETETANVEGRTSRLNSGELEFKSEESSPKASGNYKKGI